MWLWIIYQLASTCLTHLTNDEVKGAIRIAQENLNERDRNVEIIKDGREMMQAQKAKVDAQLEQIRGDLLMETTKILVGQHGVNMLPELRKVDIKAIMEQLGVVRKKRDINSTNSPSNSCSEDISVCKNRNIRSITGICNNLYRRKIGAAVTPLRRLKHIANYADGFNAIRTHSTRRILLPSPREISNKLHKEGATPVFDYNTNHFYMQFGQWIAHDIIHMPSSVGPQGENLDCSSCNSSFITDNCSPIFIPADDEYFPSKENDIEKCMRFTRALNAQDILGERIQINQNTHYLDLSVVYGSDNCEAALVRSFKNGELKTFDNGYVLPPQAKHDMNCQSKNPYFCFVAGDFRNSLQPGLIPLHTVYIKEHNRIAKKFKEHNPIWDDEKIYQESRRVNIAQYQHHVYSEYLPKVLGDPLMRQFNLKPRTKGYHTRYSTTTEATLSVEFAAAAFRFGHSQVRKNLPRISNTNITMASSIDLGNNIFYAESLYQKTEGGTESLLEGMLQRPVMKVDQEFSFPIRNQLFEIRGKRASGIDLISINIMRGRDVGLFPYNEYRKMAGLKKVDTFDELKNDGSIDDANVEALKTVYADVNDIDLYTGIMLEKANEGGSIGRTGGFIIAEQFSALKRGDRFFYENMVGGTRGLLHDELKAIRQTTLSKVICGNSKQTKIIGKNIFSVASPRVPCGTLPELDLHFFVN